MRQYSKWRYGALVLLVLGIGGCSVAPSQDEDGLGQMQPTPNRMPEAQGNPAVLALLESSLNLRQAGNYEQAAAMLERALRLEPRNAMLWHRLAQVRLSQGQWRNAIDLAAKSNSLAGGERDLQASNWLVIAQAKERQGDRFGAQAARARMEATGAGESDDGVK